MVLVAMRAFDLVGASIIGALGALAAAIAIAIGVRLIFAFTLA